MKTAKRFVFSTFAAAVFFALCGAAAAENRLEKVLKAGRLVVATEPYFSPYEFIDNTKTGQDAIQGCDIEMAKYIADNMGVKLELVPLEFPAVLAGISQGRYDLAISALAYTPKRAETLELSDVYRSDSKGHSLIVRRENADKYKSFDDFDGKVVGYHTGTLQEQLVEAQLPKAKHRVYDTVQNAVLAVDAGKVDATAVSVMNGEMFVAANPNLAVLPLRFKLEKSGNVIAATKGEKELIARVNEIIAEIKEKDLFPGWEAAALEKARTLGIK